MDALLAREMLIAAQAGVAVGQSSRQVRFDSGASFTLVSQNRSPKALSVFISGSIVAAVTVFLAKASLGGATNVVRRVFLVPETISVSVVLAPDEQLFMRIVTGNVLPRALSITESYV